jgi:hypothetical protein
MTLTHKIYKLGGGKRKAKDRDKKDRDKSKTPPKPRGKKLYLTTPPPPKTEERLTSPNPTMLSELDYVNRQLGSDFDELLNEDQLTKINIELQKFITTKQEHEPLIQLAQKLIDSNTLSDINSINDRIKSRLQNYDVVTPLSNDAAVTANIDLQQDHYDYKILNEFFKKKEVCIQRKSEAGLLEPVDPVPSSGLTSPNLVSASSTSPNILKSVSNAEAGILESASGLTRPTPLNNSSPNIPETKIPETNIRNESYATLLRLSRDEIKDLGNIHEQELFEKNRHIKRLREKLESLKTRLDTHVKSRDNPAESETLSLKSSHTPVIDSAPASRIPLDPLKLPSNLLKPLKLPDELNQTWDYLNVTLELLSKPGNPEEIDIPLFIHQVKQIGTYALLKNKKIIPLGI